jgi:hypothetical protein
LTPREKYKSQTGHKDSQTLNVVENNKISAHIRYGLDGMSCAYTVKERTVFGKMKMEPAKRAQTQNAGEVPSLQWFFSQSVELMMDKVCPDLLLAKYLYN